MLLNSDIMPEASYEKTLAYIEGFYNAWTCSSQHGLSIRSRVISNRELQICSYFPVAYIIQDLVPSLEIGVNTCHQTSKSGSPCKSSFKTLAMVITEC